MIPGIVTSAYTDGLFVIVVSIAENGSKVKIVIKHFIFILLITSKFQIQMPYSHK